MTDIQQIRDAVKAMYPNENWNSQVDRMADDQVIAIYLNNMKNPTPLPQKEQPPQQGRLF